MPSLSQHCVDQLYRAGVKHAFHLPGDYSLPIYKQFHNSPIKLIGTSSELAAGYAADAYARVNGIGLAIVTYCVGGFSILNAVAQAEAEKSPVIFLSGSPGIKERRQGMMLHHMVRTFECQHKVFSEVTCANTVLRDPTRAGYEIDRVLAALKAHSRPVYIEIPRDMMDKPISYSLDQGSPYVSVSDEEVLNEVLDEVAEYINGSTNPVILAGEEIARFGLQDRLKKFAEKTGMPVATSLLGKSVFNERHPLSLGIYCGSISKEEVSRVVDQSDCLIVLGVMQTDVNLGFMPLSFGKKKIVLVTSEECRIRNSFYKGVVFSEFMEGLLTSNIRQRSAMPIIEEREVPPFVVSQNSKITVNRLFQCINTILNKQTAVLADIGDSLFGSSDLVMHSMMQFLSPAFYTSMGFSVPGCLGVMMARPDLTPLVFVGDGAFQMTGMEFSSLCSAVESGQCKAPKIFVLNNQGYSTERLILDGPWNDIRNWNFENVPVVVGGGKGYVVETEGDLDRVLAEALPSNEVCIINVKLSKHDISSALSRFGARMKKRI